MKKMPKNLKRKIDKPMGCPCEKCGASIGADEPVETLVGENGLQIVVCTDCYNNERCHMCGDVVAEKDKYICVSAEGVETTVHGDCYRQAIGL